MTDELFFIRASSMSELFDCPARFEAKYITGLRMPRSAAAPPLSFVDPGLAADPLTVPWPK